MFSDELIDQLSQFIIRPHRQIYGLDKLGPKKTIIKSQTMGAYIEACRQESTILSEGKKIQISIFSPNFKQVPTDETQVLSKSWKEGSVSQEGLPFEVSIFLHTNSGSRLEGLQYSKYLLQHGHTVCLFDYSGSGVSEGDYVTMGINEARDLANVVRYLQDKFNIEKVNLWGRSMGAVTAVLYSARYPKNVRRMVLDSPFSSFRQLVKEIVNSRTGLPQFLFGAVLTRIEENLKKKLNVNMMDIDLKQEISKPGMQKIPIFFLISKDDKLVLPIHVETLYQLHRGQKKIYFLEGSHNKPRPPEVRQQCAQFLCQKISYVSSQRSIDTPRRQYLSIISRKYSDEMWPIQKKQRTISSSMIVDSYETSRMDGSHYEKRISSTIPTEPFQLNLTKKNKNEYVQTSAQSTPRDDHSANKNSGIKISLSQLKKSQGELYASEQHRSIAQLGNNSGMGLHMVHSNLGTNSSSGEKVGLNFKKHSRAMAIHYKNKIKQHINKS